MMLSSDLVYDIYIVQFKPLAKVPLKEETINWILSPSVKVLDPSELLPFHNPLDDDTVEYVDPVL